jgi:hypothetical protein
MTTARTKVRLHWEIGGNQRPHALQANVGVVLLLLLLHFMICHSKSAIVVGVVAGMTIADTVHVELKTSCLPSGGCNLWCRVVKRYVALYL